MQLPDKAPAGCSASARACSVQSRESPSATRTPLEPGLPRCGPGRNSRIAAGSAGVDVRHGYRPPPNGRNGDPAASIACVGQERSGVCDLDDGCDHCEWLSE